MNDFFEQLKWKLQRFMYGRNGQDELAKSSLIAGIILYVIAILMNSSMLHMLSFMLLVYCTYRMLSKDLYARREENRKFVTYLETSRIKYEQRKKYKIFKCKGCGRTIRVPRGKGKIEVTCPMCGNKTIHRT